MATALTTPTLRLPRRVHDHLIERRPHVPEVYFVKHIDNSHLRREVDRRRSRQCYTLLGLSCLVFLAGFLLARQHFQGVRYGYQIEQLKAEVTSLQGKNRQLRLEEASLADPQRIESLAKKDLGLETPLPNQIVPLRRVTRASVQEGNPEFATNFPAMGKNAYHER